ncbi:helix-turn-helix domain-containing protein [Microbacterium enclense]|uniref:helix-turn-helix domain-containing protein n=1 Tax=Microbacterium enclense TaxID=993073 RepID=UPI003F7DF8EF
MGGRPRALSADQARVARSAYDGGAMSVNDIATALGVARSTVYRELHRTAGGNSDLLQPPAHTQQS